MTVYIDRGNIGLIVGGTMIKELYGVTANLHKQENPRNISVYRAFVTDSQQALLEKIALRGESSIRVGGTLNIGTVVAITADYGFQRYDRYKSYRVDGVNSIHWGGGTNRIIALFKNMDSALHCFETNNLYYWDERFLDSTIEVITEIGPEINIPINLDERLANSIKQNRLKDFLIAVRVPI